MDSSSSLLSVSQVLSFLLGIGCRVALVVVISTVVRRHRPDSFGPLLGWAASGLALVVVSPVLGFVASLVSHDDVEQLIKVQAIHVMIGAVVDVVLVGVLIRGLVRIAQPPPRVEHGTDGPYR